MDTTMTREALSTGWQAWSGMFGDPLLATAALAALLLAAGLLLRQVYED